jgi:Outer membrane protein beta-barrel domain
MNPTAIRLTLLALLAGGGPVSATAQSSVSLGAWGGVYAPLGREPGFGSVGSSIERNNSFAGGARLTWWGPHIFGLEAVAGLSPASVDVAGATLNGTHNQDLLALGLKLMAGLGPSLSSAGFHAGIGPAFIRRGEDVFSEGGSRSRLGLVAGAGVRLPLAARLGLRLDAEDYMYGGKIGDDSRTWNDLILSTGLSLRLGGR